MCNCKKTKTKLEERIEKLKKEIDKLESKLRTDSNKKSFDPFFKD
jgi:hypothetical protein